MTDREATDADHDPPPAKRTKLLVDASSIKCQPSVGERRSRSSVWTFFRRGTHDGKKVAVCTVCEKVLSFNGSTTSNLQQHLGTHKKKAADAMGKQQRMEAFVVTRPEVRPCSDMRARDITQLLARWCWTDLRPINIVNDRGLRDLLAFIEPDYKPPSHTHIASIVRLKHQEGREKLKGILSIQDSVALTTDIWTSCATQAYATTTALFVSIQEERKQEETRKRLQGAYKWHVATVC